MSTAPDCRTKNFNRFSARISRLYLGEPARRCGRLRHGIRLRLLGALRDAAGRCTRIHRPPAQARRVIPALSVLSLRQPIIVVPNARARQRDFSRRDLAHAGHAEALRDRPDRPARLLAAVPDRVALRGDGIAGWPQSLSYRNSSLYMLRTDSRDRFGTPLERRFARDEIRAMMSDAGMSQIIFSDAELHWRAMGRRVA